MIRKISIVLLAILAIVIGLYPSIYFFIDRKFGLLQSKSEAVLTSLPWNIAFYTHIILGGLALLIGWTQFIEKWRNNYLSLHRNTGKVYVIAALASALAGMYVAFYATGGIIPALGFLCLGIVWFSTTLKAYLDIRKGKEEAHQKLMIYSYASCFAAVTLRIYLPILTALFSDFTTAYSLVAWLCWVPNTIIAYFITKNIQANKYAVNVKIINSETVARNIIKNAE